MSGADFDNAVRELNSFIDFERLANPQPFDTTHFEIERFRRILENRGNPQLTYPTIHIAGSKGKGSVAATIESVLRKSGYRTGLYTSPHLIDIRERIKIGGTPISRADFARKISELVKYARHKGSPKGYRTVFEIMTTAAFEHFAEKKVDIAIIECGLGGKLDATNVLRPVITVITPVGLDHTNILGNTIEEIAGDKAQIMQQNVPIIVGPQVEEASSILRKYAIKIGAGNLLEIGVEAQVHNIELSDKYTEFSLQLDTFEMLNLRTALLGKFQADNAAIAIVTIVELRNKGWIIPDNAIREGLAEVRWPGRLQYFQESPGIVIDGAHSPMSIRVLLDSVKTIWPKKELVVVFAANRDKNIPGMLNILSDKINTIIITKFDWLRAAEPENIEKMIEGRIPTVLTAKDTSVAFDIAQKKAGANGLIVLTGSLYLAGEALKLKGYRIC